MKLKRVSKEVMSVFSRNLKRLMFERDITGVELAEICKVDKSAVSRWLNCVSLPNETRMQKLEDYFHVSEDELLGNIDQEDSETQEQDSYTPPSNIETYDEAVDFLKSLNLLRAYGGLDINQKTEDEVLNLAKTIHSVLKMQGVIK